MEKEIILDFNDMKLSLSKAEAIVDIGLRSFGINFPQKDKHKRIVIFDKGGKTEKKYKFSELVKITRETGICEPIQQKIDKSDNVFGGTFSTATNSKVIDLEVNWAGFNKKLKGPFRNTPSEIELSNDIEFYREETCSESWEHNFELCYRNYRAYLFTTLALVDAYINRHIFLSKFNNLDTENFQKLKDSRKTEDRIELFLLVYSSYTIDNIKPTKEWSDFKKLQNLRNEITHSTSPYLGISIRDLPTNLNLSQDGIGGLLKKFQEYQNRKTLGFIEKVRNSSTIFFKK